MEGLYQVIEMQNDEVLRERKTGSYEECISFLRGRKNTPEDDKLFDGGNKNGIQFDIISCQTGRLVSWAV